MATPLSSTASSALTTSAQTVARQNFSVRPQQLTSAQLKAAGENETKKALNNSFLIEKTVNTLVSTWEKNGKSEEARNSILDGMVAARDSYAITPSKIAIYLAVARSFLEKTGTQQVFSGI